jgi:hypothetical protein
MDTNEINVDVDNAMWQDNKPSPSLILKKDLKSYIIKSLEIKRVIAFLNDILPKEALKGTTYLYKTQEMNDEIKKTVLELLLVAGYKSKMDGKNILIDWSD